MAATSPYSPNNYQVSQFQPAELPLEDIFKGISVKNQYWNLRASAIKSTYDKALDLDLTLSENRNIKDEYLKNARNELKKLSTMNLNEESVQKKATQIFEPIFKDRAIIYDDTVTKLRKSVIGTALSYRDKDGGKEFSDINLEDALSYFDGFSENTTREQMESIYNNAKNARYIPYYDFSKTMQDALSNCKGSKNKDTDQSGLNFKITETSGIEASQAALCIESAIAMDNRAMEQMGINARVNFKRDPDALYKGVNQYLISSSETTRNKLIELQTRKLAAIKENASPEILDNIQSAIDIYSERLADDNRYINKIKKGESDFIDKDFNTWSQRVYKKNIIDSYATPRATLSTSVTYEGNPGAIAEYREKGENARFAINQENIMKRHLDDLNLEQLKLAINLLGDNADNSIKADALRKLGYDGYADDLTRLGTSNVETTIGSDEIVETIKKYESDLNNASSDLVQAMKMINGDQRLVNAIDGLDSNPTKQELELAYETAKVYIDEKTKILAEKRKNNPNAQFSAEDQRLMQVIQEYTEASNVTSAIKNSYNRLKNQYDNSAEGKSKFSNVQKLQSDFIKDNQYITGADGTIYSAENIIDIFNNPRYKIETKSNLIGSDDLKIFDTQTNKYISFYERDKSYDKVRRLYRQMNDEENNYKQGLDNKLRAESIITRYVLKGTPQDDKILADEFTRIVPNAANKNYDFKVKSKDTRTGEAIIEVIDNSTEGKGNAIPMTKDKFRELFSGDSGVQVNQYFSVDDKGRLKWKSDKFKTIQNPRVDDMVSIVKLDLKQETQINKSPSKRLILTSSKTGDEMYLEAVPFSKGVEFQLKVKNSASGKIANVGPARLTEDQVEVAVEQMKKELNF